MRRRLRMGIVGGAGGFIGRVHLIAARMDDRIELACGAFSSSPERSIEAGRALFLPDDRIYASWREMLEREAARPEGDRMDFVTVAVPNHLHAEIALAALEAGFHVVCEKPMTTTIDDARRLVESVRSRRRLFCLTHNYSGYPMVKEARQLVAAGKIGRVLKVVVEYPQGWMSGSFGSAGVRRKTWKIDPVLAGGSCCVADIGTHAHHLAEYVTGRKVVELCADLTAFVDSKPLEDDANILVRFDNGARGILYSSQISTGEANALRIRVYGVDGGLEWFQEDPNHLIVKRKDGRREIWKAGTGNAYLSPSTRRFCWIPHGHPEGFIEAFANLYRAFADDLEQVIEHGMDPLEAEGDYPRVENGLRGVAFVQAALRSHAAGEKWTRLDVEE